MELWPRPALLAKLSAYNRDLGRTMLWPLAIFSVLMVGLFYLARSLDPGHTLRQVSWLVIAGAALVTFRTVAAFHRAVSRLSKVHGLICPSCGAALGLGYATLKRAGTCHKCGTRIAGEA